jgi:hypothetical protein
MVSSRKLTREVSATNEREEDTFKNPGSDCLVDGHESALASVHYSAIRIHYKWIWGHLNLSISPLNMGKFKSV